MSIVFHITEKICQIVKANLGYDIFIGKQNTGFNPEVETPVKATSKEMIRELGVREKFDITMRTVNVLYVIRYDTPAHTLEDNVEVIPRERKYTITLMNCQGSWEPIYRRLTDELTALSLEHYTDQMEIMPETLLGNCFRISVHDEDEWESVPDIVYAFIQAGKVN